MIVGNEWVPIRSEPTALDANTEIGYYFFHTGSMTIPATARFYVDTPPPSVIQGQVPLVTVYERGDEVRTGPTKTQLMPVTSTAVTGTAVTLLNGASTAVEALNNPSDSWAVQFNPGTTSLGMNFFFAGSPDIFENKRIVRLELEYALAGMVAVSGSPYVARMSAAMGTNTHRVMMSEALDAEPAVNLISSVKTLNLGEINHWWSTTQQPYQTADRYPWTYTGLQQLQTTAGQPVQVILTSVLSGTGVQRFVLTYAALRVTYCEENRVYVGGKYVGDLSAVSDTLTRYDVGTNIVSLRNLDLDTPGSGTFPEREYTVTVRLADTGEGTTQRALSGQPIVEATRQLYPLSTLSGVRIDMRHPVGFNFTVTDTNVLPEITLHTTSNTTVTGSHAYGERYESGVYHDVNTGTDHYVTQGIVGRAGATPEEYPQLRFYARRFEDGDTRPLQISVGGNTILLTAEDFDEYPEVADGYREVTIDLGSDTPSFSGTGAIHNVSFMDDVTEANGQWQILTARAITSVTGVGAIPATYGGYTHADIRQGDYDLSGDVAYDVSVMFSQQPPDIVSFDVTQETQAISVVDPECPGVTPDCMPTGLEYNQITWAPYGVLSTFSEAASGTWGSTDTDQAWSTSGGAAGQYVIVDGEAGHLIATNNVGVFSIIADVDLYNVEVRGTVGIDFQATNDYIEASLFVRRSSSLSHYRFSLRFGASVVQMNIVEGGVAVLVSEPLSGTYAPGDRFHIVGQAIGTVLRMKAWKVGTDEPNDWMLNTWDESITHGTVGARSMPGPSNTTPLPQYVWYDDIQFTDLNMAGVELQRTDEEDDDWHTIMRTENQVLAFFNDYEARVDTVTRYRMRTVNALDFYGDWTTSPEVTIAAPGVTGAGNGNSVLIFTTNNVQDGSSNLAYVMSWDRDPDEEMNFPEAGSVKLQELYGRDYVTAFRPLERGGDRFSRVLLVQNAAIPTGRLKDGFRSLRDLAWADVPYVCVRNEVGDRWFATVLVPSGSIKRNRRLLLAQVEIVETTATPSVVDPDDDEDDEE
jgi:hypothetical protein